MDVLQLLCFMVCEWIKGLACVWHEERLYAASPVQWNGAGNLLETLRFPCC